MHDSKNAANANPNVSLHASSAPSSSVQSTKSSKNPRKQCKTQKVSNTRKRKSQETSNVPAKKSKHSEMSSQTNSFPTTSNSQQVSVVHTGIWNLGTTCYAASILQILFRIDPLQPLLDTGLLLANHLKIMQTTMKTFRTTLHPGTLFELLNRLETVRKWRNNVQEDAHEFFMSVTQKLHEEQHAQDPYQNSAVLQTIYCQMSSLHTCTLCGHSFLEHDLFSFLPVKIQQYPVLEQSDFASQRQCTQCGTSPTMCNNEISIFPPVLFVMLQRFDDNANKINMQVPLLPSIHTKNNTQYNLSAVVMHEGTTSHCGHYWVLIRQEHTDHWLLCNDDVVTDDTLPRTSAEAY